MFLVDQRKTRESPANPTAKPDVTFTSKSVGTNDPNPPNESVESKKEDQTEGKPKLAVEAKKVEEMEFPVS